MAIIPLDCIVKHLEKASRKDAALNIIFYYFLVLVKNKAEFLYAAQLAPVVQLMLLKWAGQLWPSGQQ